MRHVYRVRNTRRLALLTAVCALAVAGSACNDPIGLQTRYTNSDQTFAVYALSGSPITSPAAMSFVTRTVVRVDGTFAFDIAFDINQDGDAVILPVGQVGTPVGGAPLIGLQRTGKAYALITEAPRSGYVFDSSMVVRNADAVVVQAQQAHCASSLTGYIFTKLSIDSVNVADRRIYGRTLINVNCGSRQLTPGVPKF